MDSSKRTAVSFDDEIFLVGETYTYRGTPLGTKKRREISLGIKKGALQKDVLKRKKEVLDGLERGGNQAGSHSFSVVSEKYLDERVAEEKNNPETLSKKTLNETTGIVRNHFQPYFSSIRVEDITQKLFGEYCDLKRQKKLTLPNHRKVMNHFMRWCVTEGYLKYRIELEIPKRARHKKRQRVVLSEEQIKILIQAYVDLIGERKLQVKHLLYVVLYMFMGMRNMEICKLRWADIDFEKRALRIDKMSNRRRKERAIPLNSYAYDLLQIWKTRPLETRSIREARKGTAKQKAHAKVYFARAEEWVFPSRIVASKTPHTSPEGGFKKGWAKALDRASLDVEITPHDCRATFETFMHTNPEFTDTQREKMAGADIDVQKQDYVTMRVEHLRGLEESVKIEGMNDVFGGITGGKETKQPNSKPVKVQKKKGIST